MNKWRAAAGAVVMSLAVVVVAVLSLVAVCAMVGALAHASGRGSTAQDSGVQNSGGQSAGTKETSASQQKPGIAQRSNTQKADEDKEDKVEQLDEAAGWLKGAKRALRFDRVGDGVLHYHAGEADEQNYQSDRTYPPYFSAMQTEEGWFDVRIGAERLSTITTFPGSGPLPAQMTLTLNGRAYGISGEKMRALPATSMHERNLDPWAVVSDWIAARDARAEGKKIYRDYRREVLVRGKGANEERLWLDLKTGFPVRLELEEKHYLWGQRHIEYVYTNWTLAGGVMVAGSSFRLADGKIEISRSVGDVEMAARSAAPTMELPADLAATVTTRDENAAGATGGVPTVSPAPVEELPLFLRPIEPTVTQLGKKTYLLSNPGYNELVTQVDSGEVFLFDATQGEMRAKEDAAAIKKLFPGVASDPARVTVVVTDEAWPHVAGMRWWVSQGATIVAHWAARNFLEEVVARKWTMEPDELERKRGSVKLKILGAGLGADAAARRARMVMQSDNVFELGGGHAGDAPILLTAIDGIGSEVALMAYLPGEKLLWASDYVQTVEQPTSYADEVYHAAQRVGFQPTRVVAEHLAVTDWSKVENLVKKDEGEKTEDSRREIDSTPKPKPKPNGDGVVSSARLCLRVRP